MAQVELAHKKWARSDENWRFGYQNKSSVFEKVKPHRARIFFWKSVKTCPKLLALPNFFNFSPTMAHVEPAHKKWAKSDKNWRFDYQNKSSVFEKVKPHRARILFWKLVKTCPKWLACPIFFYCIPNYGSSGACPQKMSQIGRKLTIWLPKQKFGVRKS